MTTKSCDHGILLLRIYQRDETFYSTTIVTSCTSSYCVRLLWVWDLLYLIGALSCRRMLPCCCVLLLAAASRTGRRFSMHTSATSTNAPHQAPPHQEVSHQHPCLFTWCLTNSLCSNAPTSLSIHAMLDKLTMLPCTRIFLCRTALATKILCCNPNRAFVPQCAKPLHNALLQSKKKKSKLCPSILQRASWPTRNRLVLHLAT